MVSQRTKRIVKFSEYIEKCNIPKRNVCIYVFRYGVVPLSKYKYLYESSTKIFFEFETKSVE